MHKVCIWPPSKDQKAKMTPADNYGCEHFNTLIQHSVILKLAYKY